MFNNSVVPCISGRPANTLNGQVGNNYVCCVLISEIQRFAGTNLRQKSAHVGILN